MKEKRIYAPDPPEHQVYKPWSAHCYFVRLDNSRNGWLFYSYSTPVAFVNDDGACVTTHKFSRTTSAQITRYFVQTLLGRYVGAPVPQFSACSPGRESQTFFATMAALHGLSGGRSR